MRHALRIAAVLAILSVASFSPRAYSTTCQYGVICPTTWCSSLQAQCQSALGAYGQTFTGKCCPTAAGGEGTYGWAYCTVNGQKIFSQSCRIF